MSTKLTKEQWLEILHDPQVTKNENIELFKVIYSHEGHKIFYKELKKPLKDPRIPTNSFANRIVSKYSKKYNIELDPEGTRGKGQWWLFFDGWFVNGLWVWSLKTSLVEALKEMSLTGTNDELIEIDSSTENISHGKRIAKLEQRYVRYHNGKYSIELDITAEEWKTMLADKKIFTDKSKDMIHKWFLQTNHQVTNRKIMSIYKNEYPQHKAPPFNGIVKGLVQRILKHLNRFEVIGTDGKHCYWIVLFEGWHENYKHSSPFVWKLRKELVQAIEELRLFDDIENLFNDELESTVFVEGEEEGKKIQYFTTKYERSQKNRSAAIQFHGLTCRVCGFNFEDTYGELGKYYIEVHHRKPLYIKDEVVEVDYKTDLVCVCSNCHRMLHRKKDCILSPEELKAIFLEKHTKMDAVNGSSI